MLYISSKLYCSDFLVWCVSTIVGTVGKCSVNNARERRQLYHSMALRKKFECVMSVTASCHPSTVNIVLGDVHSCVSVSMSVQIRWW